MVRYADAAPRRRLRLERFLGLRGGSIEQGAMFPTEDIGWLTEECGEDLFLFSSDYPHPEGGRDPLGKFEATMAGMSDEAKERFFSRNYAEMMSMAIRPST